MKKSKFSILLSIILCIAFATNTFADLGIIEYFNGLTPQSHINKLYSVERRNELKGDTVNFDDIEDIIHLYNPEVLNNWNSWQNNKSEQDIYSAYQDAADSLYDSAGSQDSELQEGMLMAQARAMQIQADKNASDSYINFLTNYLVEKQLALATKVLGINYFKSTYELLNAQEAIKEATRESKKAENAFKFGSGTKVDLLTAKKAVVDAQSSLITAESSQKNYKRRFLLNCGKLSTDDIYIAPIDLNDNVYISSINLEEDYKNALKNNIQYEIYRRKIENARTDEVKNEFKILYDAAPEKLYNDLENKYRNILDAMDTHENKKIALELAIDNQNKASNEYKEGNISVKDYQSASYDVVVARNNLQASEYDIKMAVETYKYAVMGFSDC